MEIFNVITNQGNCLRNFLITSELKVNYKLIMSQLRINRKWIKSEP
jgi:hypothetical protein